MATIGSNSKNSSPVLAKPTFEHHHNGLGLGCNNPRISWRFEDSHDTVPDWQQREYEIEVVGLGLRLEIFKVTSIENVLVP